MMRLRKNVKSRIPNKLAALSAILLLVTALTGGSPGFTGSGSGSDGAAYAENSQGGLNTQAGSQTQQTKKLNVSLMLFRAN